MSRTPVAISNLGLNLKPFVEQTIGGYSVALEATLKAAFCYALPRSNPGITIEYHNNPTPMLAAQKSVE